MLLGLLALSFAPVKADTDNTPVVTLGRSLTTQQQKGTVATLTQHLDGDSYNTITVTGDDLVKYLNPSGSTFTSNSGVWSSAMIQKTATSSGINVQILTYQGNQNITTITANQYKNAALTAGISDANIYITSATPIDGSGALAGIYKAYAKDGNALNQKQVNAAQNEMGTLSQITQANQDKKGYSDTQLNNAVAGAKAEMAKAGSQVSRDQITTIVNNQINQNKLTQVITNNQKEQIINLLIQIRNSGALKNHNFKTQAQNLTKQIQSGAKNLFNRLNTTENRNFIQKTWDAIVNFFTQLFKKTALSQKTA